MIINDETRRTTMMSESESAPPPAPPEGEQGGTATVTRPRPTRPKVDRMPPWKVLLHNDDVHEILFVVETVLKLTPLKRQDAVLRTLEAHESGLAMLLATHREHAELLEEQFTSAGLTVTIEPDDS